MAKKTTKTKPQATEATEPIKATKPTKSRAVKPPAKSAKEHAGTTRLSALDAAAEVLEQTGQSMTCRELIEAMAARRLWTSPAGATPWGTLSAAIAREIKLKGADSRFTKAERGKFARA